MLLLLHIRKTLPREDYFTLLLLYQSLMSTPMIYFTCVKAPAFQARPMYQEKDSAASLFPAKGLHTHLSVVQPNEPLIRPSDKSKMLKASIIWDNFFQACEDTGKELLRDGAIGMTDLDAWRRSNNKILNIGIPAYVFARCFLVSIKEGSSGFLMRDNVELTSVNRPEGRVFDWLYEPMFLMKEQLKHLNLEDSEGRYFYKHCLYSSDAVRIESWQNGGIPPCDEIRRAQLEGISRRLQGFCLTLSRLPTSRRKFLEVEKTIEQEAQNLNGIGIV